MGELMGVRRSIRRLFSLLLGAVFASPVFAQTGVGDNELKYLDKDELEFSLAIVAIPYFWSVRCGIGDPQTWVHVVEAIDRRLSRCAALDSNLRAKIALELERAERTSPMNGAKTALVELAFWRLVEKFNRLPFDAEKICADHRASPAIMDLLAPGSVSEKQREAAREADRQALQNSKEGGPPYCEWGYCASMMLSFRKLGEDQRWVEAPCDPLFPENK